MLQKYKFLNSYLSVIKEEVQTSKGQQFANRNKVKYDPETNTVDCLNNRVLFNNVDFINETFDFKLINLSDNCSWMFDGCTKLNHLPNDFILPEILYFCDAFNIQYKLNNKFIYD